MSGVRVVPALLTNDRSELRRMVDVANKFAPFVQVDIMDGRFVDSTSISADDLAECSMGFKWEAHLMVEDPSTYLKPFMEVGATRVIFHIESNDDPGDVIARARSLGIGIGVAINPDTPVSAVEAVLPLVDSLLVMSVYPGYYGAAFVPEVLDKSVAVRRGYPELELGIDGGIKEGNLGNVARAGFDTICVGSAIFRAPDPVASYRRLSQLASTA